MHNLIRYNTRKKLIKYKVASIINRLLRIFIRRGMSKDACQELKSINKRRAKYLLIVLDQLGDSIMATAVPPFIKNYAPDSVITILTRPINMPVFIRNPYVDKIYLDDAPWWSDRPIRKSMSLIYWLSLVRNICKIRNDRFDAIIDLRGDLRHLLIFGFFTKPKALLGYDRTGGSALLSAKVFYNQKMHEIDKKLSLLSPFGIKGSRTNAMLYVSSDERSNSLRRVCELIGEAVSPIILVDPGAKPIQQWPLTRWVNTVQWLWCLLKKPVLVSAGPAYRDIAQKLVRLCGPHSCRLVGDLRIRELFSLVAVCDLIISSDTGVAHIAAALKIPAITLYGPTDPARFWHGVDARGIVRSPDCCRTAELHEFCYKEGSPTPGNCMLKISQNMVINSIVQILNSVKKQIN